MSHLLTRQEDHRVLDRAPDLWVIHGLKVAGLIRIDSKGMSWTMFGMVRHPFGEGSRAIEGWGRECRDIRALRRQNAGDDGHGGKMADASATTAPYICCMTPMYFSSIHATVR